MKGLRLQFIRGTRLVGEVIVEDWKTRDKIVARYHAQCITSAVERRPYDVPVGSEIVIKHTTRKLPILPVIISGSNDEMQKNLYFCIRCRIVIDIKELIPF